MSRDRTTGGPGRVALVVVALALLALLAPLAAMALATPMGGMMGPRGVGWGLPLAAALGAMLVWLGLVAGAGYLLYRSLFGGDAAADPALEELRLAYARGDVSEEEFEERRERLRRD